MAGRLIVVDITWVRKHPGHGRKEGNAVAFQVLIARGDCVGALEVQVFVAGSARATSRSHGGRSCLLPPAHTTHCLRQVWRQMQSLQKIWQGWGCKVRDQSTWRKRATVDQHAVDGTWVMRIHREPCWVEIALDASALLLAQPPSVLLNALEDFRSVTAHRECLCVCEVGAFRAALYGTREIRESVEYSDTNVQREYGCVCECRLLNRVNTVD